MTQTRKILGRRTFIKRAFGILTGLGILLSPWFSFLRQGFAKTKRIRVVAEDYYGDDWVKYVIKVTANKMGKDRVSIIALP